MAASTAAGSTHIILYIYIILYNQRLAASPRRACHSPGQGRGARESGRRTGQARHSKSEGVHQRLAESGAPRGQAHRRQGESARSRPPSRRHARSRPPLPPCHPGRGAPDGERGRGWDPPRRRMPVRRGRGAGAPQTGLERPLAPPLTSPCSRLACGAPVAWRREGALALPPHVAMRSREG